MSTGKSAVEQFRAQLRQQLAHLQNSTALYDSGQHHEAVRIATTIRILLHDPAPPKRKGARRSVSLLTHLGVKQTVKLGSVAEPGPVAPDVWALEVLAIPGQRPGSQDVRYFLSCDEWWQQTVHVLGPEQKTRGDIVLFAADQDGGAHIDAEVEPFGSRLREGMWTKVSRDPATRKRRRSGWVTTIMRCSGPWRLNS